MKKNIIYSIFGGLAIAITAGCLPKDHNTYTGATVVEFKNHTRGVIDTALNRRGVYSCTAQTDSSRSVNESAIAYKATATTPNTLTCVTAGGSTYRLVANPALAANARTTDSILVQLIGPQRSTPTVVNYTIRPTSTAVEGTHYSFRTAGARSVTIPANSSAAYILVDIKPGALTTAGSSVRLILDMQGASDAPATPNYNKFLLTIRQN
jgi:hypothetical protein